MFTASMGWPGLDLSFGGGKEIPSFVWDNVKGCRSTAVGGDRLKKGWRVNKIISRSSLSTPHSLSSVRLVHYKYGSEEAEAACCGPSSTVCVHQHLGAPWASQAGRRVLHDAGSRLAYGDGASGERPIYTVCDNCGRVLCVDTRLP